MTLVITCGPAFEPIDGMRRLTNASTGALGSTLAGAFDRAGHRVILLRGEGSTAPLPELQGTDWTWSSFGTNEDLARELKAIDVPVDAVLHAAALCDYRVAAARDAQGNRLDQEKIPSRAGRVFLELEPAVKVLPHLRAWFPRARIVGWKYELNGGRTEALEAARRQLAESGGDACVINGRAWGEGFGLYLGPGRCRECADAGQLASALLEFLLSPPSSSADPWRTGTSLP